jgi:hypothetical protein
VLAPEVDIEVLRDAIIPYPDLQTILTAGRMVTLSP